jgi:hypothetical protein
MEEISLRLTRAPKNVPGTGDMPRPLVSELPAGLARGQAGPAEVLALKSGLGCFFAPISLGLRRRPRLGMRRIADSFRQHFAQLSLSFLRLARRLPLGHVRYMGMPKGELSPNLALAPKLRNIVMGPGWAGDIDGSEKDAPKQDNGAGY